MSESEFKTLAMSDTVRACSLDDLDSYIRGAQFCVKDNETIHSSYPGRTVYVILATKGSSSDKFSFTASGGGSTTSSDFNLGSSSSSDRGEGYLSLTAKLQPQSSGDYRVDFKKNGVTVKSKTVKVTVDD